MSVLSLENLAFSAPPGKRLVVLGDPIAHSLSPAMHNAALTEMAKSYPELSEWRYDAVHVPAAVLPEALQILYKEHVMGINLTIPHKVDVLELIADIDPTARSMGAVNTLKWTENGYSGTNTDGYGIRKAVEEAFSVTLEDRDIWLFGAGGAARGIAVACLEGGCARLTVVNRSKSRLLELQELFVESGLKDLNRMRFCAADEVPEDKKSGCLLINATSLGLKETDIIPIPDSFLGDDSFVYDTTYGVKNALARECLANGIPYADGLSMLVWQGALSLEIWTGRKVPETVMREAAEKCLKERNSNG